MAFNTEYAETLHRHVVIWVDKHIGIPGNNEIMKDRFRRITYPLQTFIEIQPAIDYIHQQQAAQMSVFLIVSGAFARQLVPEIYDLDCVKQIFIYCAIIKDHTIWAGDYIDKVYMFDFDEDLLIRLTNEIANHLSDEANTYEQKNQVERAAGLLDWAAWLYNDADTLERAACQKILEGIKQRRLKLNTDHHVIHPDQFNNE